MWHITKSRSGVKAASPRWNLPLLLRPKCLACAFVFCRMGNSAHQSDYSGCSLYQLIAQHGNNISPHITPVGISFWSCRLYNLTSMSSYPCVTCACWNEAWTLNIWIIFKYMSWNPLCCSHWLSGTKSVQFYRLFHFFFRPYSSDQIFMSWVFCMCVRLFTHRQHTEF